MCPTNGMEGKGPRWGGVGKQILKGTQMLLSIMGVGLNEPVVSQSWGRGVKRR